MWRNTVVNDTQVRRCIVEQCSSTNLLLFNPFSTVFNFSLPLFNFSFRNIDTALSPAIPVSMLVPSECCVSIHNIIFLFWFFFFCPFFNQLKINKKKLNYDIYAIIAIFFTSICSSLRKPSAVWFVSTSSDFHLFCYGSNFTFFELWIVESSLLNAAQLLLMTLMVLFSI